MTKPGFVYTPDTHGARITDQPCQARLPKDLLGKGFGEQDLKCQASLKLIM